MLYDKFDLMQKEKKQGRPTAFYRISILLYIRKVKIGNQ